ncbi:MAG: hypothetical protein QXX35_05805 [Desulfurococcaceae archaeon]
MKNTLFFRNKNVKRTVFKIDFTNEHVYKLCIQNTRRYLENILVGEIVKLDWFFFRKTNKSFVEALIEEPIRTLNYLMEYYGIESFEKTNGLKYVVYISLKTFFLNNPQYYEKAFNCLINHDIEGFIEIIREFINRLKQNQL